MCMQNIFFLYSLKRKSGKYDVFNNENPLTDNNQIHMQEVEIPEEIESNINEKSEEKMLEALDYSDTKPIITTDDEN